MKMILKRAGELPQIVETNKKYRTEAVREFLPDADIQERVYLEIGRASCRERVFITV